MKTRETHKKASLFLLVALLCMGLFATCLLTSQKALAAQAQTEIFSHHFEEDDFDTAQEQADIFSENMEENETVMSSEGYDPPLLINCSEPINKPDGFQTLQDTYSFALGDLTIPNSSWPSPFNAHTIENPYWHNTWPGMIRGVTKAQTYAPKETLTLQQKRDQLNKLANLVKDDLTFLGKTVTGGYLMTSNAEYDYNRINYGGDSHIAIRIYGMMDYYFMRFESNWGEWRHKPSAHSVILRLGNSQNGLVHDRLVTTMNWYNEEWRQVQGELEHKPSNWEYPGEIYIISYQDASWQTNTSGGAISITGSTQLYDTANIPQKVLVNNGGPNTGVLGPAITGISSIGNQLNLKEISIPSTITSINSSAFNGCPNLEKIVITSYNQKYYSNNCGVLFGRGVAGTADELIFIPPKSSGTFSYNGLTIQDRTVTAFTPQAGFSGNLVIPEGITAIGNSAFSGCTSLSILSLPSSISSIGTNVFKNCNPNLSITWNYNPVLTAENFSEYLTKVNIPGGTSSISATAFSNCTRLANITISNSVTTIGADAFKRCSSLTTVTFEAGSQLTSIGEYAFLSCSSLTSLIIPNNVLSIADGAFSVCSKLTSITISSKVTSIGINVFGGCNNLTNINVEAANNNFSSYNGVLFNKAQTTLITCPAGKSGTFTVPSSVTNIKDYAFFGCSKLIGITILSNITSIGNNTFADCSSLTSFTIPASVTTIGNGAFSNCSSLKSITIPKSVESISKLAFYDCDSLNNIIFEPNSRLTTIGSSAFDSCDGLMNITLPNSVTIIESGAFIGCTALTNIVLPNNITSIENSMFVGCWNLANVIMPDGVTSIGDYAFAHCPSLINIAMPSSVTSIGNSAFLFCSGLESVIFEFDSQLKTIGESAFSRCQSLTNITLPNGVENIQFEAFRDCASLTNIKMPASVTYVGSSAFYGCNNLTIYAEGATKPSGWESISCSVIWDCTLSPYKMYVLSFTKTSISNPNASNGMSAPDCFFGTFGGWSTTLGGTTPAYTMANVNSAPAGTTLYAIWNISFSKSLEECTWIEIAEISSSGKASSLFNIGDKKTVSLTTGESFDVVILGFNHDDATAGNKAGITFGMVSCLNNSYAMRTTNVITGGWSATYIRNTIMPKILSQMPKDLQFVIEQVNKKTLVDTAFNIGVTSDKLFLFSEVEIDATTSVPLAYEGQQYEYYRNGGATNHDRAWWLRSPHPNDRHYYLVAYSGGVWFSSPTSALGVSFGFCIGTVPVTQWTRLEANGSNNTTTTELTLTFDKDPTSALTMGNIKVEGAKLDALSGTGLTRILTISNITVGNGGMVKVTLTAPFGVGFIGGPKNVKVYVATAPTPQNLNSCSWSQIATISAAGNASLVFKVGDKKTIALTTGEQIAFVILGFNHDDLTTGGKASITFGMENCLAAGYRMNAYSSGYGGWGASEMRISTMQMLLSKLPSDLQPLIKTVMKKSTTGISEDKLFLFSEREINNAGYVGEGEQYDYWKTNTSGIKCLSNGGGATFPWWLRSVSNGASIGSFRYANTLHEIFNADAQCTLGVSFGFCV